MTINEQKVPQLWVGSKMIAVECGLDTGHMPTTEDFYPIIEQQRPYG